MAKPNGPGAIEALGIYDALGAAWDVQRARSRFRAVGLRTGRAGRRRRDRPATGWDALTPMEVRVAALVADGLSNPGIAEQLVQSRQTVEYHVSHVLTKLGAKSRTDIAREVIHRQHTQPAII